MIAVDTNILVYAHRRDAIWHERAAAVLTERADDFGRFAGLSTRNPLVES